MGHRDCWGKSCWRWLDPKKRKNTMKNPASSSEAQKGDWELGGEGEGGCCKGKEEPAPDDPGGKEDGPYHNDDQLLTVPV